jgi:hypothetical protein
MENSIGTNKEEKENFTNGDQVFRSVSDYFTYKTKKEARNGL